MVGSIECKTSLVEKIGLPNDQISSSHVSYSGKIAKGGFDIVLNCVSGDANTTRELWQSLGNFGRFIQIQKTDGQVSAILETTSLQNNRSFMSVDLMSVALEKPKLMKRLLSDVSEILGTGRHQGS